MSNLHTKAFIYFVLFALMSSLAGESIAQEPLTIRLEEVVVTASRTPLTLANTNRSVLVLDSTDIENLPANNVPDLLKYALGVDVQTRGAGGVQSDVSIRGGSFEQTLVLIDGVKMSDPQTGHHLMNLPVAIEDVERIEILKGHGSRIYGPNAFGGVINIITRSEIDRSFVIKAVGGDFKFFESSVSAVYPIEKSTHRLTLSKKRSDGFKKSSEFDISNVSYNAEIDLAAHKLGLKFGYNDKEFGASNFYSDQFPEEWEHTTAYYANISDRWRNKRLLVTPQIHWRRHEDDFILDRSRPEWYRNEHIANVYGIDLQASYSSGWGITSIGGELAGESIASSNLGDHDRTRGGVFIEHFLDKWRRFEVATGAFAYGYSGWGWKIYPGADIGFRINPNLKVFGTIGGSFRVPTFTDLYYDSPANKGNENLKPERALTYETGSKLTLKAFKLNLNLFRREGRDMIDWVRSGAEEPWIVRNIAEINTYGFESSCEFNPQWYFQYFPVTTIRIEYGFYNSDKQTDRLESKYALSHLRHHANFHANLKLPLGVTNNWRAQYKERIDQEGFLLIDTRFSKEIGHFGFFVDITNVLDRDYYDVGSVEMPGRWFMGGIEWEM